MAYELVTRLENGGHSLILQQLQQAVNPSDKQRGKLHQVFEPSFDWKECRTEKFIRQKLDYMHKNPVSGKWNLVPSPVNYLHSSCKFYYTGVHGDYPVLNYLDLNDMEWVKPQ